MTRRARKQAHRLYRHIRGHHKLPLTRAVPESTVEAVARAGLQLLRGEAARREGRQRELDLRTRRHALVVHTCDRHGRRGLVRIDKTQPAHLVDVAAGVEDRNTVADSRCCRRRKHARQETIRGADVREHLDIVL